MKANSSMAPILSTILTAGLLALPAQATPANDIWSYAESATGAYGWRDVKPDAAGIVRTTVFIHSANAKQADGLIWNWTVQEVTINCRADTRTVTKTELLNASRTTVRTLGAEPTQPNGNNGFFSAMRDIVCYGQAFAARREAWSEIDAFDMAERLSARKVSAPAPMSPPTPRPKD